MILQNSFYNVASISNANNVVQAGITINPAHDIFRGHFPGQPVVPGVCMVQIVKELMEQQLNTTLLFSKGHQLKFLRLLTPEPGSQIEVNISWKQENDSFATQADFKKQGETIFKLSGIFTPKPA